MFGFIFGALCLVGMVGVLRRGRWHARYGHGYGCGHEREFGGHGRGRRRGWGPNWMLRGLFQRLDTTPGQEKVISEVLGDLRARAASAREDLGGARREVASALRQETFDEALLGNALSRLDNTVDTMRKAGLDAFAKVHGALDERQRGILAEIVESGRGPFGHHHASPYRI